MKFIRNRHIVARIVAASCVAVSAAAPASASLTEPPLKHDAVQSPGTRALPQDFRTDAAQSGDHAAPTTDAALPASFRSDAAQSGPPAAPTTDAALPASFRSDAAQSGAPAASTAGNVLPASFTTDAAQSGRAAERSPAIAPTTIEVIRPERTIVRDVDEALPLVLSGTALALVLAAGALTLLYVRMLPRAGRSH